mmetsp:Transcript_14614/g.43515  ORF Transcript_14614/g.43515 Transcript_14614/m.43515 type:complete len:87 (+) Transcript_14614:605-865(+)
MGPRCQRRSQSCGSEVPQGPSSCSLTPRALKFPRQMGTEPGVLGGSGCIGGDDGVIDGGLGDSAVGGGGNLGDGGGGGGASHGSLV